MDSFTELFCLIDDFYQELEPALERVQLENGTRHQRRTVSLSELMLQRRPLTSVRRPQ